LDQFCCVNFRKVYPSVPGLIHKLIYNIVILDTVYLQYFTELEFIWFIQTRTQYTPMFSFQPTAVNLL